MQEDTATLDHSANWGHPYNCPKKKGELKTERSTSCEEREFYGPGSINLALPPKLRMKCQPLWGYGDGFHLRSARI